VVVEVVDLLLDKLLLVELVDPRQRGAVGLSVGATAELGGRGQQPELDVADGGARVGDLDPGPLLPSGQRAQALPLVERELPRTVGPGQPLVAAMIFRPRLWKVRASTACIPAVRRRSSSSTRASRLNVVQRICPAGTPR